MDRLDRDDTIIEHLLDIKGDIGQIKGHLVSLNGSVARHEETINKNVDKIQGLNKKQYWILGIGTGVVFILGILIKIL